MAKLLAQFALNGLLNPHYLVVPKDLPERNPLRDPPRHWRGMAASHLDARLKRLRARDRAAAKAMLGKAESFHGKCEQFFEDTADDLGALEDKGVSPNIIGASMVLYAWDWTVLARNPGYSLLKTRRARHHSSQLQKAGESLDALLPVALLADLRSGRGRVDRTEGLLARGEHLVSNLRAFRSDLDREVRKLQRRRGRGHLPDEKLNILLYFLARVFKACSGTRRLERLSRLAEFAKLPGVRAKWFEPQHVRQRLATVAGTPLAAEIEMKIAAALRAAEHLST